MKLKSSLRKFYRQCIVCLSLIYDFWLPFIFTNVLFVFLWFTASDCPLVVKTFLIGFYICYNGSSWPRSQEPSWSWRCEFEPRSEEVYSIQHYVIKFVIDLRQVGGFLLVLWFPTPIKLTVTIFLKIVESGIKHHNPNSVKPPKLCYTLLLLLINGLNIWVWHQTQIISKEVIALNNWTIKFIEWASHFCLTPIQQFFSYMMARTS